MKKLFEKHSIAKVLGIFIFVAIVLTWILPYGMFSGAEFIKYEPIRVGLNDLSMIAYNSIYYAIDKIVYLLVLGGFYAVISKTDGYKKLVSNIVNKIKGKETLFVIVTSVVITILTSVTTTTFAMLLFVPLLISIMINAGINKLTAFASTFGAILVGILGATYGTEVLNYFNQYYSQTLTGDSAKSLTLIYRIIILVIGVVLYNFFLYYASKKSLNNKKKNNEEGTENFIVEEVKAKKVKVFPIGIVLGLLAVIFILGFVDWNGIFGITVFDNLHNSLIEFSVGKDFKIISYLLGTNTVPFGTFDLFTISTVLVILTVLTAILYAIKFDELLSSFGEGALNLVKPIAGLVAVYSVFIIMYMSPVVPTMVNSLMKKDGVPDINVDYNGSGVAWFNIDTDDDGKADYNLVNPDNNGKCKLNCDTNGDGFPDKNIDFNGNKTIDDYDKSIMEQLEGGTSIVNLDTDGDGIPDVNIDNGYNLFKTIIASVLTNLFHVDLGYTGYSMSGFFVEGFGAYALELTFLVFFAIYGLLQFFVPTSLLLIFGLIYTKVDYKDWLKHIWRFVLGMLCVLLIIFIFISMM